MEFFLSSLNSYLKSVGFINRVNLVGIDLDCEAVSNSIDKELDLRVMAAEDLSSLNMQFDLVLSYELIEHLIDPSVFMLSVNKCLNKKGLFIFTTPNSLGLEARSINYNKKRLIAHGICPPMHLNAFNVSNILLFANKNNFKFRRLYTPGKLDMALISSLSEQLDDEFLKTIATFSDDIKGYIQYIVSYVNGSGHMRIVLEK